MLLRTLNGHGKMDLGAYACVCVCVCLCVWEYTHIWVSTHVWVCKIGVDAWVVKEIDAWVVE